MIQQRPPEVLTRCPDAPEPPTLAPLPAGAPGHPGFVPRADVVRRDVATGRWLGQLLGAHATCHANSIALRQYFGLDQAKAPTSAPTPQAGAR